MTRLRARTRRGRAGGPLAALGCALLALASAGCVVRQPSPNGIFSPDGKPEHWYDPGRRPTLTGAIAGPDLLTDARISLDDPQFAGKVVVINTWGSWCGPCRGETPALEATYQATKEKGVAFLGIDLREDSRDSAKDYVLDRKVSYPSIYDPAGRSLLPLSSQVSTSAVPTTVVLDRSHAVALVHIGAVTQTSLEPLILKVVAE
ncbi:TlpA disulfide reductase family protein [Segniliparus rugosus]|uniref:Thioredoxin domain-containing protein n=1 Tax=Segniliparus rugosus (strain ATCC BAA-974 / DSM 45345 / CCUG 50838 / CIP 108380 / JCM 13579 / CDC 945) TaxID=679197 RepID=E5XP52_SEGRC|nr:TlpA disulfide reductase family protein [Segniliparus rugosus]EFV13875.1 hypothetical protein HMPREF9336_01273 [Segniliparus rugosus ATCC BAA-974]